MRVDSSAQGDESLLEHLEVDFQFSCPDNAMKVMKSVISVVQKVTPANHEADSTTVPQMQMDIKISCDSTWTEEQIFVYGQSLRSQTNICSWKFGNINHWDRNRYEKYLKIFVSFLPNKENLLRTLEECFEHFELHKNPTNSIRRRGKILPESETSSLESGSQIDETRASTPNNLHGDAANTNDSVGDRVIPSQHLGEADSEDGPRNENQDNEARTSQNRKLRDSGGAGSSRSSADSQLLSAPSPTEQVDQEEASRGANIQQASTNNGSPTTNLRLFMSFRN